VKLVIVVPDGMADRRGDFPEGRTPLARAHTPVMDLLAAEGECGTAVTVPDGVLPGSDSANMAVLGVDPASVSIGRAAIEAAGRQVAVEDDEVVFRMNLVTVEGDVLSDYSAGSISPDDARPLVEAVAAAVRPLGAEVALGVSYRHLMRVKDPEGALAALTCVPPHDMLGGSVKENAPRGAGAERLLRITSTADAAIAGMSKTATAVWCWGQGRKASLPSLRERFGVRGAVITAVDLVRGLGRAMGMDVIEVEGANGDIDTNFAGKGEAAVEALAAYDVVFVHVEAPDEASHRGQEDVKVKAIELVDGEVLSRVRREADARGDTRVLCMPDHLTPLAIRTHAHGAVPYALYGAGVDASGVDGFSERTAGSTGVQFARGWELLARALDRKG